MKKTKLLAGAVVVAIGGLAMTSIATATTTVTPLTGVTVNYTLNEDLSTVFTAGVLEISGDNKKIFILDRNLGATATGDLTSAPLTSYGYYFQWGNNYGFSQNIITGNQKIDCSGYGPNNPLYNNVLIYGYYGSSDYCLSGDDNLWGNTTNTNEARRGPCPENFHVPTSEEVSIIRYNSFNGLPVLIPLAGYMSSYNGSVLYAGSHYYLWSSSPGGYSVYNLGSEPADIYRTSALPIRCVYNYNEFYENTSSEGGSGTAVTETNVILTLTEGSNTCTLNDYNLGTHDTSTVDQNVESSGQEIVCEFLKNSGVKVLLSMENLSDGVKIIGAENFTGVITANGNSLGSIGNLTGGSHNLLGSREIYNKEANTIGKWTGNLQIIGRIPAGTPSGTYTGQLNIVIQEGF